MPGYAYIPYIPHPQTGAKPTNWLETTYYGYEAFFSTQTDTVVKCAYRKNGNGTLALLCAGALSRASGIQLHNVNNYSETVNWSIYFNNSSSHPNIYYENYLSYADTPINSIPDYIPIYDTIEEILDAFDDGNWDAPPPIGMYHITYRPTNCTFPNAPTEAAVGDMVTVPVSFTEGYGLANNSDIYVKCNNVLVPSTYDNGTLTFTMPDPSQQGG